MTGHRAVVLADQPSTYEAVRTALGDAEFDVVGTAASLTEVMALMRRTQPDLAVLDLAVVGRNGLAAVHAFSEAAPDCALLLLTPLAEMAEAAVRAGAFAVIEARDPARLQAAVRSMHVRLDEAARSASQLEDLPLQVRRETDISVTAEHS